MAHYRLYFMQRSGGHIADCEEFDVDSDAEALEAAEARRRLVSMELWCDARRLCSWDRPLPRPARH